MGEIETICRQHSKVWNNIAKTIWNYTAKKSPLPMHYERFYMQNFNFFDCIISNKKTINVQWKIEYFPEKYGVMYEGVPRSRDCIWIKYLLNFWSKRGAGCLTGCISEHSRVFLIIKVFKRTTVLLVGWTHSYRQLLSERNLLSKMLIQKSR